MAREGVVFFRKSRLRRRVAFTIQGLIRIPIRGPKNSLQYPQGESFLILKGVY